MHLTINIGLSNVINLIWDNYAGFDYSTYYVNRYHPSTGWNVIATLPSSLTSYTDQSPLIPSNTLIYSIEVVPPSTCTSTKAQDHNTTRSNRHTALGGSAPSGIDELDVFNVIIYPNPAQNNFRINSTFEGEFNLSIYSIDGKRLMLNKNLKNSSVIDVSQLSTGVYIVEVENDGEKYKKRLVINK
tara:strand:- start:59 stop:616 length:558 start_codon:yes stop_codon:yes gene_type:complete